MKFRLLLFFFLITSFVRATDVKVGIGLHDDSCTFISAFSSYSVYDEHQSLIASLTEGSIVSIIQSSTNFKLLVNGQVLFTGKKINFKSAHLSAFFRVKIGNGTYFPYDDQLIVKENADGKSFTLINLVNSEKYIAGVIESEAGENTSPEFLKVQAVIARTFVFSHLDRHEKQGFSVCATVHCQVYHARSRFNDQIQKAALATEGLVLVDKSGKILTVAYHSNCGGQTVCASEVWTKKLSYLQSVSDSFCSRSGHALWEKTIERSEWNKYLWRKIKCPVEAGLPDSLYTFSQSSRKNSFVFEGNELALKDIRSDWKLNSTFFSIEPLNNQIIFKGRGYGHGVGLCQEGAMQMAAEGIKMEEILSFYFIGSVLKRR